MRNDELEAAVFRFEKHVKAGNQSLKNGNANGIPMGRAEIEFHKDMTLALSALRDALKRADGCEYCAVNDWERKPLAEWTTYFDNWVEEKHELYISDYNGEYFISPDATEGPRFDIQYCPMCGRLLSGNPKRGEGI